MQEGKILDIGVSNFNIHHLEDSLFFVDISLQNGAARAHYKMHMFFIFVFLGPLIFCTILE